MASEKEFIVCLPTCIGRVHITLHSSSRSRRSSRHDSSSPGNFLVPPPRLPARPLYASYGTRKNGRSIVAPERLRSGDEKIVRMWPATMLPSLLYMWMIEVVPSVRIEYLSLFI